jgi:hypothetical protein
MKLLNCISCQDIVLLQKEWRTCKCGKSSGRYTTAVLAEYQGPARIIGVRSLDYHRGESGREYPWWFIEKSDHIKKLDEQAACRLKIDTRPVTGQTIASQ